MGLPLTVTTVVVPYVKEILNNVRVVIAIPIYKNTQSQLFMVQYIAI